MTKENEMMTNEELAEFEKENKFNLFNSECVVYPGYTMEFLIKSPKTCAVGGIEKVTEGKLHLEIPSSVEINGNTYWVNEIFAESFWGKRCIESVTIPDTVTCIDYGAFNQCEFLKEVYIPDSVTVIDEIAFTCCKSLKSVSLPANVKITKDSFDRRKSLVITRREPIEPAQVSTEADSVSDKKNESLPDENMPVWNGKKTFTHDNFNELSEIDKLQVLTDCECMEFKCSVENYFKYREKGKKEGFIPVLVDTDDIFFEQLEALLKCDGESSISKIQKIVEEYHEKMLAMPVEDGKAYLEKNHIDGEWDDDVDLDGEEYEAEEHFTKGGYLVKVPVTEPWRIWAYLPYGGWNACPKVSEHMAVSKYLYEQYGAYPAALSYDTIDYAVEKPAEDLEKLANEIGTYCYDIVEQGCETYSALALELQNSRIWNLWWD